MMVVNGMENTLLAEKGVFMGRGSTVDFRLTQTTELHRRKPYPTSGTMNKDTLCRLHMPTEVEHDIGRQIVHRAEPPPP